MRTKHTYPQHYKTDHGTLTIYRDRKGELRWRVTARNGKNLLPEGYKRRGSLVNALHTLTNVLLKAGLP